MTTEPGATNHPASPPAIASSRIERVPFCVGITEDDPDFRVFATLEEYMNLAIIFWQPEMRILSFAKYPQIEVVVPAKAAAEVDLNEVLAVLDSLPDPGLVRKLTLVDGTHAYQNWVRQERNNPELVIESETIPGGEICVYLRGLRGTLGAAVLYEWNHLLKLSSPEESAAFDLVGSWEQLSSIAIPSVSTNPSADAWAWLGELMLGDNNRITQAVVVALTAPVHASVWAHALKRAWYANPGRGPIPALGILAFIEAKSLPAAIAKCQAATRRTGNER